MMALLFAGAKSRVHSPCSIMNWLRPEAIRGPWTSWTSKAKESTKPFELSELHDLDQTESLMTCMSQTYCVYFVLVEVVASGD